MSDVWNFDYWLGVWAQIEERFLEKKVEDIWHCVKEMWYISLIEGEENEI